MPMRFYWQWMLLRQQKTEEDIVLMGFDAGKEQIAALKNRNDRWSYCAKVRSAWDMRQLWRRRGLRLRSEMRQPSIQDMFGWIRKYGRPGREGMLYE